MNYKVNIVGVDTSAIPKLSQKECKKYLEAIQEGDQAAREYFLFANQRLVLSVLHRFDFDPSLTDDIFQVGCLGLTKALNNFDPRYGVMFSTYAVPMIIGEIRRFLRENSCVKVSRKMRDIAYQVVLSRNRFAEKGMRDPAIEEIAADINVPVKEVCEALDAIATPLSLYDPVYGEGEEGTLLMDQIADGDGGEKSWVEMMDLNNALKTLSDKEKTVIELRYYQGKTQTEVSGFTGVSQAQVSRLEQNAIKKLRECLA